MAFKIIASQCTSCSACEAECPNVAISEKGGTFVIDPKKCTECIGHFDTPQCVAVCPVDDTCVIDNFLPALSGTGIRRRSMNFQITPAAAKFIRLMLRADGAPAADFRLAVSPGGCSGLAAEIGVEAEPEPGDAVVERDGVKLFLPAESRMLLDGVTIDFADTPSQDGARFPRSQRDTCSSSSCSSQYNRRWRANDRRDGDSEPQSLRWTTPCLPMLCSAADCRPKPSSICGRRGCPIIWTMSPENHLREAQALAPGHVAVLIGLYRFYFYKGRLARHLMSQRRVWKRRRAITICRPIGGT